MIWRLVHAAEASRSLGRGSAIARHPQHNKQEKHLKSRQNLIRLMDLILPQELAFSEAAADQFHINISSHRPTGPRGARPEDMLWPVPIAELGPGIRACEEIGCIAAVRASRRAYRRSSA